MLIKRLLEYGVLWGIGGTLYYSIEVMFRGYSHWTMFVLGGVCMMFFAFQGFCEPLWKQVLRSVIFVTACEFITGIIVNKYLGWNVWDYSQMPCQILGQICLPFMLLFAILCVAGILISGTILHYIFKEKKPCYRLL